METSPAIMGMEEGKYKDTDHASIGMIGGVVAIAKGGDQAIA